MRSSPRVRGKPRLLRRLELQLLLLSRLRLPPNAEAGHVPIPLKLREAVLELEQEVVMVRMPRRVTPLLVEEEGDLQP